MRAGQSLQLCGVQKCDLAANRGDCGGGLSLYTPQPSRSLRRSHRWAVRGHWRSGWSRSREAWDALSTSCPAKSLGNRRRGRLARGRRRRLASGGRRRMPARGSRGELPRFHRSVRFALRSRRRFAPARMWVRRVPARPPLVAGVRRRRSGRDWQRGTSAARVHMQNDRRTAGSTRTVQAQVGRSSSA
jgi:hypothetical protein